MIIENLAAWTPAEDNPPYLSINYCHNGTVTISIRERGNDTLGITARVVLTEEEFQDVLNQLKLNINKESDKPSTKVASRMLRRRFQGEQ